MIKLITQQRAMKIPNDVSMTKDNDTWVKVVDVIKHYSTKFDRSQRVFIFLSDNDVCEVAEQCGNLITVDDTDYNTLAEKRFERITARRSTCPDCGNEFEIETDSSRVIMYCEICEG